MSPRRLALTLSLSLLLTSPSAPAATGICDQNGDTAKACVAAIQALGADTVVNDVFRDKSGKTGWEIDPKQFGSLFQHYMGCNLANTICNGAYDTPESKGCPNVKCVDGWSRNFDEVATFVSTLDFRYANPIRMHDGHPMSNLDPACPSWEIDSTWVSDGDADGYKPWEGMVFDLHGPSNKVVIFAVNDHGPQPCESTEYTVYLSDNPYSEETIELPATQGADPKKWNRAVLSKVYQKGSIDGVRPTCDAGNPGCPDGWTCDTARGRCAKADCGDEAGYDVEADSFVTVYSLPCGITFRYVAIAVGNDGKDGWNQDPNTPKPLEACTFHSYDGEIDAVLGLTEEGNAACPDADQDGFVACSCASAPAGSCDCDDEDKNVNPGAPERCDDPDKNCDGKPGSCEAGLTCHQGLCLEACNGSPEFAGCQAGASCKPFMGKTLCVPDDCSTGGCPPGSTCQTGPDGKKTCVPDCAGVFCPQGQQCLQGRCVDLCKGVTCPSSQQCVRGYCAPLCNCFEGNLGCVGIENVVCDRGDTNTCVPPGCDMISCPAGQHCGLFGGQPRCVGVCDDVTCPKGQVCDPEKGQCVGKCDAKMCGAGETCNPVTGYCEDTSCVGVTCFQGKVCVKGVCQAPPSMGAGGSGGKGGESAASSGGSAGKGGGKKVTTPQVVTEADEDSGESGGCGCEAVGSSRASWALAPLLLVPWAIARRRRRVAR